MVFRAPSLGEFGAFSVAGTYMGATDNTTCLDWSCDSNIFAYGSNDCTVRIFGMHYFKNFWKYRLTGNLQPPIGVFFERDSYNLIVVTADGLISQWKCDLDPSDLRKGTPPQPKTGSRAPPNKSGMGSPLPPKKSRTDPASDEEDDVAAPRVPSNTTFTIDASTDESGDEDEMPLRKTALYKLKSKTWPKDMVPLESWDAIRKATAVSYHSQQRLLVIGFKRGTFLVIELPECSLIHTLNFSNNSVSAIALNNTGDWIALASAQQGQVLVWEWQSETYVMKQQGHRVSMSCISYSGDGQHVVTGGEDGKVKLWNTTTGFCFVTFSDHTSAVVQVVFSSNRKFIMSASLDGTVRAYDLTRYRNFRTLTTPQPVQFSCLTIDSSNDLVAAGCQDVFEIYLWSTKLGKLLEIINGHEAPVSGLAFSPSLTSSMMASVSWDGTMRLWDAVDVGTHGEPLLLPALGLAVTWSPDGETVAASTLNGEVTFFDAKSTRQVGSLEGRKDLGAEVLRNDLVTAKTNLRGKAFTTLCYSPDGRNIMCGGASKNVCIYSTEEFILVRKIQITQNRSFDGVDGAVNKRLMTEWGNAEMWEERSYSNHLKMPGALKGDASLRTTPPEVRVFSLQFSPTGHAFGAATTEGLLIYSLDASLWFDPFQLDMAVTPASIRGALKRGENTLALASAIRLNEANVTLEAFETIPLAEVELTVSTLPKPYVIRALRFVASALERTRHVDLYVRWARWLLLHHGAALCPGGNAGGDILPTLLLLQKNLTEKHDSLSKICDHNKYSIQFLLNLGKFRTGWDAEKDEEIEATKEEDEVDMEVPEEADDEDMLMYL